MQNIMNYTLDELEDFLIKNNFKKFNAIQIYDWIYKKRIFNFKDMTNLNKKLIEFLEKNLSINFIGVESFEKTEDTIKYLFKLLDGNFIEAVVMKHNYGNSLCVSSQVGCNMGCKFCESGRLKKVKNLETYEMVEQILLIEKLENIRIDNLVVMGIGEPFDNYNNLCSFLEILTNDLGINLGQRRITVSTCGIIPKIKEFINLNKQVNLAISLHASNNDLRDKLMPINKVYPLKELLKAVDEYILLTNRRVTIEYIMLKDLNDKKENAMELVELFKNKLVYINLIPYNETENFTFKKSKKEQILKFYDILKKNNINVTIRREFGSEISAACGQLRAKKEGV